MNYETYSDKVFGCYLGKSIGGSFGAPFEGVKQKLNVAFDFDITQKILMNDDLDLQVLFFQGVKKYGKNVNSDVLAKLFYSGYPMSPGEYAYFKKNFERGINPPYSGSFNNHFYSEGMGCCIRGELWGCLFAGNPHTAIKYATHDGCLDHSNESIVSEHFISTVISLCFVKSDIKTIIEEACEYLEESRFKNLVLDVIKWCDNDDNHFSIRDKIISKYGHPDCTNVFQNNGIIIMCLLKYFDDFPVMCERANACGFDTDCTVGICASVYGAVRGGKHLEKVFGVDDVKLVLGADCYNYNESVKEFSSDVSLYGSYFSQDDGGLKICGAPEFNPNFCKDVMFSIKDYSPVLNIGESSTISVILKNYNEDNCLTLSVPEGFTGEIKSFKDNIVTIECAMLPCSEYSDKNLFTLNVGGNAFNFGFYVPEMMYVSKPYFETYYNIDFNEYSSYLEFFKNFNNKDDAIRNYHLSYTIDTDKDYMDLKQLSLGEGYGGFERINNTGDKIEVSKILSYKGPCILYLVKEIYSETEREVRLIAGASDYMDAYLNGERLLLNEEKGFFTFEKKHLPKVHLYKGRNVFAFKLVRTNKEAEYSVIITEQGESMLFPKHMLGFKQKVV